MLHAAPKPFRTTMDEIWTVPRAARLVTAPWHLRQAVATCHNNATVFIVAFRSSNVTFDMFLVTIVVIAVDVSTDHASGAGVKCPGRNNEFFTCLVVENTVLLSHKSGSVRGEPLPGVRGEKRTQGSVP